MRWTDRATSAKCEVCGHGYGIEKVWTSLYAICKEWYVGHCRACGRSEKVTRV